MQILAQKLIQRKLYEYCSNKALKWSHRRANLLAEVRQLNADIMCLQELDMFDDFWSGHLRLLGYTGVYFR